MYKSVIYNCYFYCINIYINNANGILVLERNTQGMNNFNFAIFCDFDGTITKNDTIDYFLSIFANDKWLDIETLWKRGEIGSKECLEKQLKCVENISESQLYEFIENVEIDESIMNFLEFISKIEIMNKKKIDVYVISDGFDVFINNILKKYGINYFVEVFSNKLKCENNKMLPSFPFYNSKCKKKSGLCKCEIIKNMKKGKRVIYIGDGISDICASGLADILFAKGSLAEYCSDKNINHVKFETFRDICEYLYLILGEEPDAKNTIFV